MKIIIAQAQLFNNEESQRHLQSLRQKGSDRGGSFGLENFLAQPFDDENFEKHVADMEEQEIRKEPRKESRKPSRSGLPTYGLESMTPLQDFDRHLNTPHRKSETEDHRKPNHREYDDPTLPPFRPISRSEIVTEKQNLRFDEGDFPSYRQTPGKNKIRNKYYNEDNEGERFNEYDGNLRKPLERPNMFRKNNGEEVHDPETTTGRPKKRITMRRRRKRPQGSATSEDSSTTAHEPTQETIAEPISRVPSTADYKTTTEAPVDIETEPAVSKRKRPMGFRRINKNNQPEQNPKDNIVPEESNEKPIIDQKEIEEEIEVKTTTHAPSKSSGVKAYKPKIDRTEPFLASTETLSVNRLREETPETPAPEEDKSANRLKSFLKQKGSVSLSEFLQTQNLSLTDFLKGKRAEAEKAAAESTEKNRLKSRHDTTAAASISVKSRPFSKNENTVRNRYNKKDEEDEDARDKEEENSENDEKPAYNGFTPKNARRKFNKDSQKESEPENKFKPIPTPSVSESVSELDTEKVSLSSPTSETTLPESKTEPKRGRDHQSLLAGLHQQNYRRKLKIPSKTIESTTTTEVTTPSTSASTTTTSTTTISTSAESTTATEGYRRKKLPGLKIPIKSANNPDLSLIIPNKRTRNYFNNRIQTTRIPQNEKEELDIIPDIKSTEEKQNEEVNIVQHSAKQEKSPVFKLNESLFNFDKSQEADVQQDTQKKVEPYNPPAQIRPQEEPRNNDEILELLKSAATAQRLEKILAARNMTIGELLLNREKGSAQANFSNLFTENKTSHYPVPTDIALEDSLFSATSIEVKTEEVKKPSKKEKSYIDELETGETSINNRVVINPEEEYEKRESRKINKNTKFNNFGEGMEYSHGFVRNKKTNDENIFFNNEKAPTDGVYFFVPTTRDTIPPTQIYTNSKDDTYRESKFNRNEYYENENNFLEEINRNNAANTLRRKNINSELPGEKQTETKDSEIDKSFIPPVVKSTIIISGVVMGIALFVFIAIFAACGYKQRQLRLKASSSILNDTLTKADLKKKVKNSTALTPISIKHSSTYKKTLDFDDTLSVSSEASSYLWNTLKNTFTSRNNTLKNRLEKEQQGMKSRTNTINKKETNNRTINAKEEAKKYEERLNSLHRENEKPSSSKKIYADREFVKTSNSFRRGTNVNNSHYRFDNWSHQ